MIVNRSRIDAVANGLYLRSEPNEPTSLSIRNTFVRGGPSPEGGGAVTGAGVDTDHGVGGPCLGRQRRKGPGEKSTAVVGDHDGGDSYFLKN